MERIQDPIQYFFMEVIETEDWTQWIFEEHKTFCEKKFHMTYCSRE